MISILVPAETQACKLVCSDPNWRYSLVVRTGGFEPLNPGSIPGSATVRKHK